MAAHCLLVIDMLNDFLDRWPASESERLVERTNQLVDAFNKKGLPVIWVRQAFKPDLSDAFLEMKDKDISVTIDGTRGAEFHPGLRKNESDPVILKKRYSAFFRTNLDTLLNGLGVERMTIAGVNTHACIRMAAIDAYQRDYRVTIATDCVNTQDAEHGRITLKYIGGKIAALKSNGEILSELSD